MESSSLFSLAVPLFLGGTQSQKEVKGQHLPSWDTLERELNWTQRPVLEQTLGVLGPQG